MNKLEKLITLVVNGGTAIISIKKIIDSSKEKIDKIMSALVGEVEEIKKLK